MCPLFLLNQVFFEIDEGEADQEQVHSKDQVKPKEKDTKSRHNWRKQGASRPISSDPDDPNYGKCPTRRVQSWRLWTRRYRCLQV